jgi:hypothetical protein
MKMQEAGMSRDPADISVFLIVIKQASNKLIIEKKKTNVIIGEGVLWRYKHLCNCRLGQQQDDGKTN